MKLLNPSDDNDIAWEKIQGKGQHWRALFCGVEIGGFSVVENGKKTVGTQAYFGTSYFEKLATSPKEAREWVSEQWSRWLKAAFAAFPVTPSNGCTVETNAETMAAKCMSCGAKFRIPCVAVTKVRCPDCQSGQVLDFNLEGVIPIPVTGKAKALKAGGAQ